MHGVEKSRARTREERKCIFVPRGEHSHMHTINWNLMMQKDSRVIQMIIAHQRFLIINIIILKMRSKNKVALAVELSIFDRRKHQGHTILKRS